MRTALVGLGAIATGAHLPALARAVGVRLVAVAEPDPTRRAAARLPPGLDRLAGLEEVLARDVDAVILATPPWATPALAIRALQSGRYVLAEKPVGTSLAACAAYDVLTDAERSRFQIGLTYRHDPAIATLREVVRSGRLGRPLLIRAHIYDERRSNSTDHTAMIESTLAHGSPVVHEGAHVFDWLHHILGADATVESAWSVSSRPGLPAPNLVGAQLAYTDGSCALVEFGWLTAFQPRCAVSVLGDRGIAVLDGMSFDLTVSVAGEVREHRFPGERVARCFDRQLARFTELVTNGGTADPSLADGIRALELSEQIAGLADAAPSVEVTA